MSAIRGYAAREKILCARELQVSIRDSVHAEIARAIRSVPWLDQHYEIGESYIRGKNGTEFIFKGLRHNYQQVKSTAGVTICWVEEAESVSESSWGVLIPTIREKGSEIWATWNPESADSATHKRFIIDPPANAQIVKLNWNDNPWFPEVLEADRLRDMSTDTDYYAHVWDGEPITRTDAQIFGGKWSVREFEAAGQWAGPYYGLDFGFANNPTAAVRCWVWDNRVWIDYEAGSRALELDATAPYLIDRVPGISTHAIKADSARPESISYLKRHGLGGIRAVEKWQGSVEGGVRHLCSYAEIVVHPRCTEIAKELRLYSYKVDRLTGEVLPVIIDAHNHYIDALRYAIEPIIRRGGASIGYSAAEVGDSGISTNLF